MNPKAIAMAASAICFAAAFASAADSDAGTYTWKPDVAEGDWNNPANWNCSIENPIDGYPNGVSSAASFAGLSSGASVTVHCSGTNTVSAMTFATGTSVSFVGDGADSTCLYLGAPSGDGSTLPVPRNGTVAISAMYARIRNFSVQDGSLLRIQDGADVWSKTECYLSGSASALEVLGGSSFYIHDFLLRMSNTGGTRLRIDDSSVSMRGTFSPSNNHNSRNCLVEFMGANPQLVAPKIMPSEADSTTGETPVFRFNVPASGYSGTVITTSNNMLPSSERLSIRFEIDAASDWFKGWTTRSFQLASAPRGIRTDYIDFSAQPAANQTRFFYTYGTNNSLEDNGNAPTGLWVELAGGGSTRDLEVATQEVSGGTLSGTLSYGAYHVATPLYVAYGSTYGMDDTNVWDHVEQIGASAVGTAAGTVPFGPIPGIGTDTLYARFFFDLDGEGHRAWSGMLYFGEAPVPSFAAEVSATGYAQGDSATVHGELLSAGTAPAIVTVETSRTGNFLDAVSWPAGTFYAAGDVSVLLHTNDTASAAYIAPGSTTYYRFKVVDAAGLVDTSGIGTFTTPAAAVIGAASASSTLWNATYTLSLIDPGAGGSHVELWTGRSADSLSPATNDLFAVAGPASFDIEHDAFGTVYYAFYVSNGCATASWETWSATNSVALNDTSTFTWKDGVTEGDWDDPACWESSSDDPRSRYPDGTLCTATFAAISTNSPVRVNVGGDYSVGRLVCGGLGTTVVFAGEGKDASSLAIGAGNGATVAVSRDAAVEFSALGVSMLNFTVSQGSRVRITDGADVVAYTESNINNGDTALEVTGGSSFFVQNFLIRMDGVKSRLLIDDSRVGLNGNFAPANSSSSRDCLVEFKGSHPRLEAPSIYPAEFNAGSESPVFRFNVPATGYEEAVIYESNAMFPFSERLPVRLEVDGTSEWFRGGISGTFQLINAPQGIRTNMLDLGNQPRDGRTSFRYTYGANASEISDGNAPTGLWVDLAGSGGSLLLLR